MTGYGARISLNKNKGKFFSNSAIGILNPSFDVDDLGFQSRSDVINMHIGGGYSWSDPGEVFRYAETGGAVFQNYDYGGNVTWRVHMNTAISSFLITTALTGTLLTIRKHSIITEHGVDC